MMNARNRMMLLATVVAGTAVLGAGCSNPDKTAATPTNPPTVAVVVDDAAITGKVKTALMAEPGIRSLKIDVDTKNGVVTLNGTVDTAEQKDRALQVAQNVNGVKSVVIDNLQVKSA
jgi:hyperosmotically inducible periplasmic protein